MRKYADYEYPVGNNKLRVEKVHNKNNVVVGWSWSILADKHVTSSNELGELYNTKKEAKKEGTQFIETEICKYGRIKTDCKCSHNCKFICPCEYEEYTLS